jgi:hypothetical protein
MAFELYYVFEFSTINMLDTVKANQLNLVEEIVSYIGTIYQLIVLIRIGVIFSWFNRAYKNLFALGASSLSSSTRMAKISFFIPIYNLWKPYYIFQEIWKACNNSSTTLLPIGNDWQNNKSSFLIKIAWITGILFIVFSSTGYFFYQNGLSMTESISTVDNWLIIKSMFILSTILVVLANTIFLVCALSYIKIIKQITLWQEDKSWE